MFQVFEAPNLSAAIELMKTLRREGTYQFFRGQTYNWPLLSGLGRLSDQGREHAKEQFERFVGWVHRTPGLEYFRQRPDELIAVAQHYHIKTNFVDFTTEPEVAAFFARHEKSPHDGTSCILLLNETEFEECVRELSSEIDTKHLPELLKLEIPNLWRLEAQHAVSIFIPFDFESLCGDLDRILIHDTESGAPPPTNYAYPEKKSDLERLLDQYFMNERLIIGTKSVRELAARHNVAYHKLPKRADCDPWMTTGDVPEHPSWPAADAARWLEGSVTPERYNELARADYRIILSFDAQGHIDRKALAGQIELDVGRAALSRRHLVSFTFDSTRLFTISGQTEDGASPGLSRIWDGMRRLPFSDRQIAQSLSYFVELFLDVERSEFIQNRKVNGEELVLVEFGAGDGAYSRAYCRSDSILAAVRPDIDGFLNKDDAVKIKSYAFNILRAISNPRKLFSVDQFADLVAREVVPTQEFVRDASIARIYSPLRFRSFGLA